MALVVHFRNVIGLLGIVSLLVILVLQYRSDNIARRWTAGPVSEANFHFAVPAEILEDGYNQQNGKLLLEGQLSQEVIDGVEKFVFFIGWSRSGSSIVGSLIDAHPNMVIANDFGIFRQLARNYTKVTKYAIVNALYSKSIDSIGGRAKKNKGYTLGIDGYWQGNFTILKVIGDKRAEDDALTLYNGSPEKFTKLYKHLSADVLHIPIRVMQVIRNPYDMIATRVLYNNFKNQWKTNARVFTGNNTPKVQDADVSKVLRGAQTIQRIRKHLNFTVLEIHTEEFIHQPRQTMERICKFLDVECYEEYVVKCTEKAFEKSSITRSLVVWTSDQLEMVEDMIKDHPFFQRYNFHSD